MQLLSLMLAGLTVLGAESAKSRPAGLDAAAVVEQAKQLDPQQQQAWLRRLERRLKRATTLVLKASDAEKKLAEYEMLFGHNPPDWEQVTKLVQHTDVAEKAAIGQLTRQYRIALYESLFGQRKEYEHRHDALRRVLKAWEASGQPFSRQEVLVMWLEEAVRCNTRGSLAPLPPDPDFSKDPPLELPPEAEPAKQPADKIHGQPPKPPTAEKEPPKSLPGEKKPQPPALHDAPKPADEPRPSATPAAAPQPRGEAPPAESGSDEARAMRSLLGRLGSAPIAERTAEHARPSEVPHGRTHLTTTPDGAAESPTPLERTQKLPAGPAGMPEPPEPPIWQPLESPTGKPAAPPIWDKPAPAASEQQERPLSGLTGVTRLPRGAPAVEGPIVVPGTEAAAETVRRPGWPEQLQQSAARPSSPAPLRETNGATAPQLAEPNIQTDYHGGNLDVTLEVEVVRVDDWCAGWPAERPEVSLPVRRVGSIDDVAAPTDSSVATGAARPISAPPLEMLALKPIPLEEVPKAQVNLADLNARINGYNYALRALEAELHDDGVWDSARIRLAIERLKKLSVQRRDLEIFRQLLPADQRRLAADFEPVRPIIAQLAQRISSARQTAEQARSAASQKAISAQEAAAELERLDALSRELAEYARQ